MTQLVDLVVVDGPNLIHTASDYLRALCDDGTVKAPADAVKHYFMEWFDISRLVFATLGVGSEADFPSHGIVIVHSQKDIKRKLNITGSYKDAFWLRQGTSHYASTHPVLLVGAQQVKSVGICKNCNKPVQVEETTEKGVDAEIICYLFETEHAWQSACLFSADSDFGPAVLALRRRGKRVFVSSAPDDRTTDLSRYAQVFVPYDVDFLKNDFLNYLLLRKNGALDEMVATIKRLPSAMKITIQVFTSGIAPGQDAWLMTVETDQDQDDTKKACKIIADSITAIGFKRPAELINRPPPSGKGYTQLRLAASWPLGLGINLNSAKECKDTEWWKCVLIIKDAPFP